MRKGHYLRDRPPAVPRPRCEFCDDAAALLDPLLARVVHCGRHGDGRLYLRVGERFACRDCYDELVAGIAPAVIRGEPPNMKRRGPRTNRG